MSSLITAGAEEIAAYRAAGWWSDVTTARSLDSHVAGQPRRPAIITEARTYSWQDYSDASDAVALSLVRLGLSPGERVGVVLPDGLAVHAALVGVEKAGLVGVGIGSRAGEREIGHLASLTGARALLTPALHGGVDSAGLYAALCTRFTTELEHHVPLHTDGPLAGHPIAAPSDGYADSPSGLDWIEADDLFLLNSTSGTTGLPKCVMHTQNRWNYFHDLAVAAGDLTPDDVFLSIVPAPYGFGLWTSHFSPMLLGSPEVVMARFDANAALDLIEAFQVTVLCCVSTQFILMLNAQRERRRDLSSLKCMFTGGEAVPYDRAAEFEDVTGAAILQFYGSNETGALSATTSRDSREIRLSTAGHLIPEMNVRLFDAETGAEVDEGPGRPGCRGPLTSLGYWGDEGANRELFTDDGWMLMGDIVTIDDSGCLSVVGRTSDFIIRGGKNISAPAIEAEIATHPAVAMVMVVAVRDEVFGERAAAFVTLRSDQELDFDGVLSHLRERGVSREWHPEYFAVLEEFPRSSGGKVSKADLRAEAERRWGASTQATA